MADFKLLHRDECEREGKWLLARRSLGLQSFGMNLVELQRGESIPEHDETDRDQEEVFLVLEGDAVIVIDGEDHPAKAGTLARFDAHVRRTARNDGEGPVTLMMVSAPRGSGYEPMGWA